MTLPDGHGPGGEKSNRNSVKRLQWSRVQAIVTSKALPGGRRAIAVVVVAAVVGASTVIHAFAATTIPPGFAQEVVASGFVAPTDIAFLPDGRVLVAELSGLVKLSGPGGTTTFLDLRPEVNNYGERGLIGIAVDPQFEQNGFVYAYYVYEHNATDPTGPKTARLSRFLAIDDTADPASETVLLGAVPGDSCAAVTADCIPSDFRDHHGGTIRFAADGTIFLSTGDGATVHAITPNALRSQNLDSLAGKILHVDRAGQGLSGNPFWTGSATDNRSKVWAYGLRNAFRFALRPSSGIPYVGDVGWDTTEEIDVARAGANLGWPCFEGTPRQPGYETQTICQTLYAQGPAAVTAPLVEWPHTVGGGCAVGGTFYTGTQFPAEYQGAYFYADYAQGWIRYLKTAADDSLASGPTDFAAAADAPVDLEVGPDGSLYYVAINAGEIRRIRYTPANRPPVVAAASTPTNGLAPLDVAFSSLGTTDPDGDPLALDWDFGDGSPHSSASAPTHRYDTAGTFTAVLTATDGRGGQASARVVVTVGNRAPTPIITGPSSGFRYAVGDAIDLVGDATDPDIGDVVTLSWVVTLQHCPLGGCHTHPFLSGSGPTLSFVAPDHGDDSYFSVRLTATDSGGLSTTVTRQIQPRTAALALATQPTGLQLVYDGTTVTTPATKTVIVGSTHQVRAPTPQAAQVFSSWEDASPNDRQLVVTADRTVTATFASSPAVVSDSFTRTDAPTLGTGWSTTTRYGAAGCLLSISGNQAAYPSGRTGTCDQYWLGDSAQADGVASYTVTALPVDNGEFDIQGRMQALGTTSAVIYEAGWVRRATGPDQYSLYRRAPTGAWIQIATTTGPDVAVGDQLAFKLAGTSLSFHHRPAGTTSWAQILTITDASISGAGRFGIELYNATNGKLDNWTISTDLPGGGPLSSSPPANTVLPSVSGTAQVGLTLAGALGSWTGTSPIGYGQQWQRCSASGAACGPIGNATALTYVPVAADVGSTLRLRVTATNSAGGPISADSAATAVVSGSSSPPANTVLPSVSGTAQVGLTLAGALGSWTGTSPIGYGQQWQRCSASGAACGPIGNATALTYVPVAADVGSTLRLRVTATNSAGGPISADSAATAVVSGSSSPPANTVLPSVSGTAQVGLTLAGALGSWTGTSPIGYGQQWQRCSASGAACGPIGNATALTYVPVAADVGSTLRLRVTATNSAGGPISADSAATATVAGAPVVVVSDSFDRADAAALGGSWSTTTRYGAAGCLLSISGNQAAYPSGRTGTCDQYWLGDSAQADGVASYTVTALPVDNGEFDIQGRMQALGTTSAVIYEAGWVRRATGPDQYSLYRRAPTGAWIQIATTTGPDVAVGDQLAFKLAGTSLSFHHRPAGTTSWAQILTITDASISGAGRFGIELYNATNGKLDNWTISTDLPGGGPLSSSPPANTVLPSVSGTAQVGLTLAGALGSWTGTSPIGYGQQWQRCSASGAACGPIGNATALTYVPVAADVGSTLRLRVTATNSAGGPISADSAATAVVSGSSSPPANTVLPSVSGTAQVGLTLAGALGSWTGTSPIGYGQQWQRCSASGAACGPIGNATALTYVPVAADVGSTLRLRVTATNSAGGPISADSAATATVAGAPVVVVSDSFDRADAAALGGSWSTTTRYGAAGCLLSISGNQAAYPSGRTGTCDQYWLGDSAQADGVASYTVTALPVDNGEFDIQGRMQALGTTSAVIYEAGWVRRATGPDQYSLYRRAPTGAWIQIATTTGPDVAVGDQLAFKLAGTSLSFHHRPAGTTSWAQILTITDTSISGAGRFGIELYNATNGKLDNWTISTDLP